MGAAVVIDADANERTAAVDFEPSVQVRLADGTQSTLGEVGHPFYILTFVETPAGGPGAVDPRLRRIAERLYVDDVAVVQLCLPTGEAGQWAAAAETATRPVRPHNLVRVYDPKRLAWGAFGRPPPGTLLLIDRQGVWSLVYRRRTLDDPVDVILAAEALQEEWEREQQSLTGRGRDD